MMIELSEGSTVADLRTLLAERYPGLGKALSTIRIAVNESFARDDHVLQPDDEVALISPVSGGVEEEGIWVELVAGPIPADRVRAFVTGDSDLGGIVTFEGATRLEVDEEHGPLDRLEYEAYETMARRQLERLAVEAKRRWSAGHIAILHRFGSVEPAEVSVMIAAACGHRHEAFEACRWLIEMLKQDVPIWKKDVFKDGFVRWAQPTLCPTVEEMPNSDLVSSS